MPNGRTLLNERIKQRLYRLGLPAGFLATLGLLYTERRQGTLHVVDAVGLPLLALLLLTLMVGLYLRRLPARYVERALFVGLMHLSSLGYSVFRLARGDPGVSFWNLAGLGNWNSVVYTLAFLTFGLRLGARVSAGVYLLSLGAWLAYFIYPGPSAVFGAGYSLFFQLHAADALMLLLLYGFGLVVRSQAERSAKLEHDAHTDHLTRLSNRRGLTAQTEGEIARAARLHEPFAVVLFDIDHFKGVNDRFGHDVGDRVLEQLGRTLLEHARKIDIVGRWGGEEFMMVLPGCSLPEASEAAERMRQVMMEQIFEPVGHVTGSFGVTEFRAGDSVKTLLRRADQALYRAKAGGRNRVETCAHDDATATAEADVYAAC
jgi:diguanylate cyclase